MRELNLTNHMDEGLMKNDKNPQNYLQKKFVTVAKLQQQDMIILTTKKKL